MAETNKNDVVLSVKDLHVYFYTNQRCNKVLRGVSFDIKRGKTLCVVGESGCGKSVTANSILRLLPELSRIESGSITYYREDGSEVRIDQLQKNGREMRRLRGQDIAIIFQDPMTALNPVYTVGHQIREMIREHKTGLSKAQLKKESIEDLADMGIPAAEIRDGEYPHQFSGGMRQRAMIAMGMSCEPKILLADEPTTALDVTISAQIFDLMNNLKKQPEEGTRHCHHDDHAQYGRRGRDGRRRGGNVHGEHCGIRKGGGRLHQPGPPLYKSTAAVDPGSGERKKPAAGADPRRDTGSF